MVVAVFVLCIALGSFAVSALSRIPTGVLVATLWTLALTLGLLYLVLPDSTYWVHVLRSLFRNESAGFYPFQLLAFLGILAVLGLPVALSGATLPLLFHQLRRESAELGDIAGRLYSWNTVGSLLGALLGGYALLFWLDLHHVFRVALGAVALAAVVLTHRVSPGAWGARLATAGMTLAAVVWAIVLLPAWSPNRLRTWSKLAMETPRVVSPDAGAMPPSAPDRPISLQTRLREDTSPEPAPRSCLSDASIAHVESWPSRSHCICRRSSAE